jgi:exodeoxyribonuclease V gamma subunit
MDRQPRKGDRNVKENDKHLFLETLLSAREQLYLSYIGRSQKDNSSLPPSVLLDELADYIAAGAAMDRESVLAHLLTVQPLHSFSRRYADPESGLYTYLGDVTAGTGLSETAESPLPVYDFSEISLDALIAFFKNPFRYYYNRVLSVYDDEEDVLLADTELFDLDALQQWQLKYDLLLLGDDELPSFSARASKTGTLPLANVGKLVMAQMGDAVADVRELIAPYVRGVRPNQLSFAVAAGEHTITGSFDRIYDKRVLVAAFSKRERKYHIECWLRHLAAAAAGLDLTIHYIAGNSARETVLQPGLVTPSEAAGHLAVLAALYVRGHQAPLRFMPDLEPKIEGLAAADDAGFETALSKLLDNGWGMTPDPYLLREYQSGFMGAEGALAEWLANTAAIINPLRPYFDEA